MNQHNFTRRVFLRTIGAAAAVTATSGLSFRQALAAEPLRIWTIGVAKVGAKPGTGGKDWSDMAAQAGIELAYNAKSGSAAQAAVLADRSTPWCRTTTTWYDDQQRCIEITSGTAVWFHGGKAPVPIRWVVVRDPHGEFDPQALLCTDPKIDALDVVAFFVLRWRLEVTFEEVRAHLGVETQRQWSDLAIARTTPILLGLFSWVTLAAHELQAEVVVFPVWRAAWYRKKLPTFSDALALLRSRLWRCSGVFGRSYSGGEVIEIPKPLFDSMLGTLCYAA